ncbi:hypothetical protein KR074_002836 [Drosophila pseudoananassae]|nr:hypothetical protein KR074_002836 [Drosophila pseudoananassae]
MRLSASFFVSIFALEILFVSVCRADDDDVDTLEKGIKSLSNVMVTYQAEFDNKVKFVELQEAIDQIDISMRGYQGTAKNRLGLVRDLNSAARIEYHRCVAPVFEWCISVNSTFRITLPFIKADTLSENDTESIWNMTVMALELGLDKTKESVTILEDVLNRTTTLRDLFKSIAHEIDDDFGPKGFYGKWRTDLQRELTKEEKLKKTLISAFIGTLFGVITTLIFGPIGVQIGLQVALGVQTVQDRLEWERKQTYTEKIEAINKLFTVLQEKVENATKIVEEINVALEEDKLNLQALKGRIEGAYNNRGILKLSPFLRKKFAPNLEGLLDQCMLYVEWHGYDEAFYPTSKPRSRRDAPPSNILGLPEVEMSKEMNPGGWLSPLPLHKDIVVHFLKHFH